MRHRAKAMLVLCWSIVLLAYHLWWCVVLIIVCVYSC
jgi:hypothetical protein